MYRSETQIYQAHASSNNGTQGYAFQRVNRNSNGKTTFIAIQGDTNDVYTVVQAVKDKNGQVKKRVYRMGVDYIPSLMKANKEELANDLTKVVSLSNKKTNKLVKPSTKKKPATKKKPTTKKKPAGFFSKLFS